MGIGAERRFERYAESMVQALGHADRAAPARQYLRGLMLPGQRKSVEPMAARVQPEGVRSAHQSMHHLVAESEWSDSALLAAVADKVAPVLTESGRAPCYWIHHASLCVAAYGFLMLERLSGVKKNTARLQTPAIPEGFLPRGSVPDAAPRPVVHRNRTLSAGARHRSKSFAMPVLRKVVGTAS